MVQKPTTEAKTYKLVAKPSEVESHKIKMDGVDVFVDDLEGVEDPEDKGYLQLDSSIQLPN